MYPEGWLVDPKGKTLLLFEKDSIAEQPSGSIKKWMAVNGYPSKFKSSKQASALEAITKWIDLTENGWRRVDIDFEVKAA